jgi:enamine deaminase RidA (YjgF/YER057c/UK114 family)
LPSDGSLSRSELAELRRRLPAPPRPQGGYVAAVADGSWIQTAGMTPRVDGVVTYAGRAGAELTVAQARTAAATAAENALAAALGAVASGQRFGRVVHVRVYVNATPDFTEHSRVADGASARLRELLGERGTASRVAVGVGSLPQGAVVEVELTCSLAGEE